MKRYLIPILVTLVLVSGFAGCSNAENQSSNNKEFRSATETVQEWLKEIRGDYDDSEYLGIWRVQRPDGRDEAFFYSMRAAIRTEYGQNFKIGRVWIEKGLSPYVKLVAYELSGNGKQGTYGLWVYTGNGVMWAIYGTSDEPPPPTNP